MGLFDDDNTMDIVGATREQTRLAREEARRAAWQAAITQKLAIDRDKIAREIEAAGRKYIRRRADVGMAPEDSYITKRSRFWNPGDLAGLRAGEDIYPLGSDRGAWSTELEDRRPAWWATDSAHPGSLLANAPDAPPPREWQEGVDPAMPAGDGWYWDSNNDAFGGGARWRNPDWIAEQMHRTGMTEDEIRADTVQWQTDLYLGHPPGGGVASGNGAYDSMAQPGIIKPGGRPGSPIPGSMLYPGGPDGGAPSGIGDGGGQGDAGDSSATGTGVATRYKEPKRYQYDWSL